MRFASLLIIVGAFVAEACVPFGGGGGSCGAPPCQPPVPSCGVPGGCIQAAPPPPPPPPPACGFGAVGCSQPAAPIIVNCGPSGCSPPVAPVAPAVQAPANCGSGGCAANSNCGSTGCAASSNNDNGDVQYEYYDSESESDKEETSEKAEKVAAHTEAPAPSETDYEEAETTAAPAAEEYTKAPAATEAPAEEPEASSYTDRPSAAGTEVADRDDAPCQFLTCDFEDGTLCLYQSRGFERASKTATRSRRHAQMDLKHPKPWVTWMGKFGNPVTGIIVAKQGHSFAGSYLKPGETSILETDSLFANGLTIKFEAYEATEDIVLRMCCDSVDNCQWETSKEADESSRRWREVQSTCAKGTKKVLFVCQNSGVYQGACGLDNIRVVGSECSQVTGRKTEGLEPFAAAS